MGMIKGIAIGLGVYLAGTAGALYFSWYTHTGELNPKKQLEYFQAEKKLFGKEGFADIDNDDSISFDEKKNVYARMDLKPYKENNWLTKEEETHFPRPTLSQLEKALVSYEPIKFKEALPPEPFEPKEEPKEEVKEEPKEEEKEEPKEALPIPKQELLPEIKELLPIPEPESFEPNGGK